MTGKQKVENIQADEDDELDEWDQRIFSTGCAEEQLRMNDCYYDKKDWRLCRNEMEAFRQCWKRKGNEERTLSKDAAPEK
ncbi:hypothetical protein PV08_00142 [Exophiala spinifera]|uniref:CHCH domain-containing protein n=1 Tax=Exophiala spinifera TaxID=91928 RepID=A0A0D2C7P4_9EURO|nr:uncharacterized protein PV08_00142 [Exophiala spinifera]KIW19569.1 hypothetical protein PV08_00142 [Exophiala spinifera]